jgi:hypothetical protein
MSFVPLIPLSSQERGRRGEVLDLSKNQELMPQLLFLKLFIPER